MPTRASSSLARLGLLSLLALGVTAACASRGEGDASPFAGARASLERRPLAPIDLGLRALLEATDDELPGIVHALGLGAPELIGGERWYRAFVVLEVGAEVGPIVDRAGFELRSRLGRVLSVRATAEAIGGIARTPGVVLLHAASRVRKLNEVATSVSSSQRVTVPANGALDTTVPVEAGKTYTFTLTSRSPRATAADPILTLCRDAACAGPSLLATDDDSGPGTDARLTYTATATENLIVRATEQSGQGLQNALAVIGSSALPVRLGTGARGLWSAGLRGSGAVVAVIDSGADFCHDDFTTLGAPPGAGAGLDAGAAEDAGFAEDAGGVADAGPVTPVRRTRFAALWDQRLTVQGSESSPRFRSSDGLLVGGFGVAWKRSALDAALANCGAVRSVDDDGHGTHVLGTAAGNGRGGPGERYAGAAPDADLVSVALDWELDTSIVDGVAYAVAEAEELRKPVSINLSLGYHAGPHDGTGPSSLALLAASGPGRAIVVAAGNEGDSPIAGSSVDAPPAVDEVGVVFASGSRVERNGAIMLFLDAANDYRFTLVDAGGDVVGSAEQGQSRSFTVGAASIRLVLDGAPYGTNRSLRQGAVIVSGWDQASERMTLKIERLGGAGAGRWWGWSVPDSPPAITFADHRAQAGDGGYLGTMNDLATSHAVLAVGATGTLVRVKKEDGSPESDAAAWSRFGTIAGFSSRGPGRDGRGKPDVVAPGMFVVSTLSRSVANPNTIVETGKHQKMQGTSMASPGAAGVAAQLLGLDATIVPHPLMASSAVRDVNVNALDQASTSTWGSGKLDAVAARARLLADAAPTARFREARRDAQGLAHLAVDVVDPDGAADLAYVLWDVDGDGAQDAVSLADNVEVKLVGAGPFEARAVVVDKAGKTVRATANVTLVPLDPVDAGAPDAGRRDAGADAGRDAGIDAGFDAALAPDAADEDAGPSEPVRLAMPDGCSMHAPRRAPSPSGLVWALATLAGFVRARRRR